MYTLLHFNLINEQCVDKDADKRDWPTILYIHKVPPNDKQRDQMIIDHNILCNYIVDTLFGIYLLNVQGKI